MIKMNCGINEVNPRAPVTTSVSNLVTSIYIFPSFLGWALHANNQNNKLTFNYVVWGFLIRMIGVLGFTWIYLIPRKFYPNDLSYMIGHVLGPAVGLGVFNWCLSDMYMDKFFNPIKESAD